MPRLTGNGRSEAMLTDEEKAAARKGDYFAASTWGRYTRK